MKMMTEKTAVLTLEDNEIKTLAKMINLLTTMEQALDDTFYDCSELNINEDSYNIEIFSDTVDFLKNLYYGGEIKGYLREER